MTQDILIGIAIVVGSGIAGFSVGDFGAYLWRRSPKRFGEPTEQEVDTLRDIGIAVGLFVALAVLVLK